MARDRWTGRNTRDGDRKRQSKESQRQTGTERERQKRDSYRRGKETESERQKGRNVHVITDVTNNYRKGRFMQSLAFTI